MPNPSGPELAEDLRPVLETEEVLDASLETQEVLDVTLEEAADLGLTITEQQGLRGPRGLTGQTGPQGARGERGLAGPSAGSQATLTKLSRAPLSAGSLVRLDGASHVTSVSALDAQDATCALAVVQYAVSEAEATAEVLVYGEHADNTWAFVRGGLLFLGSSGLLTQTVDPAWAFVRVVGVALTETRAFIDPQPPVLFRGGS